MITVAHVLLGLASLSLCVSVLALNRRIAGQRQVLIVLCERAGILPPGDQ